MNYSRFAVAALAVTFVLSLAAPHAAADWIETYTGGYDQTWTYVYNTPPSNTSDSTAGDKLTLLGNAGATFDNSIAGLVQTESFTDAMVRATVTPMTGTSLAGAAAATNNDVFVAARSNGVEGYLLTLDFHDGDVDLVRVNNVGGIVPLLVGINNPSWFSVGTSYQLQLRVLGTELRGRVLDLGGSELASLTVNDAILASGFSGIGAAINADSPPTGTAKTKIAAMFDDVSSTNVPEPSSLFLAAISMFAVFALIRRRRAA